MFKMKNTDEFGDRSLPVGDSELRTALDILASYRDAKRRTDERIFDEREWWRRRYDIRQARGGKGAPAVSGWLFNSICNKHADMCDSIPTPVILPREPSDERAAQMLGEIIPVIASRCGFEQIYSDNAWCKLKHGLSVYGVFWNPKRENGLGDIDIRRIDPVDLFWDISVDDIQDSPCVFLSGWDTVERIRASFPHFVGRNAEEKDGMVEVIDMYYKMLLPEGRTVLHYMKICAGELLYASQNDETLADTGWYEHGKYPIVLDMLYPDDGTAYGLLSVGRNPQSYIDELDGHILEYANWASRARYWAKRSLGINENDFLNPDKRIIEVEGDIDEEKLRQITVAPIDSMLSTVRSMKIDELKETTGNRDVSQGSTSGGVTAASAINALQEAGNKGSRDIISGSYRAYVGVIELIIELIRQFYTGSRIFRICGDGGAYRYVSYDNSSIKKSLFESNARGEVMTRMPVFDIEVKAERLDPITRGAKNELMLSLFKAGMFDAENRDSALTALAGMDFDGIEEVRRLLTVKDGSAV